MTTDYLSDEDAERMGRVFDAGLWLYIDSCKSVQPGFYAQAYQAQCDRARRAWAARPATARALDDAALDWQTRKAVTPDALVLAAHKRGMEITK